MDCGIPYCHNGCPVNNQIPDWNDLVYHGDWERAILNLHSIDGPVTVSGAGGDVTLTPFRVNHGAIDALGFRIGDLAYLPDVVKIPDEAIGFASPSAMACVRRSGAPFRNVSASGASSSSTPRPKAICRSSISKAAWARSSWWPG